MSHVSTDLETLGKRPGCVIRSIGAVVFDPRGEGVGAGFYVNVSRESCERHGLTVDPETEAWWAKQSDAAKAALEGDQLDLVEALDQLTAFWVAFAGRKVWGHGSTFDVAILDAAYLAIGREPPWKFWDVRDTRTAFDLAFVKPDRAAGVHHTALDDAINQALTVQRAYSRLGKVSLLTRAARWLLARFDGPADFAVIADRDLYQVVHESLLDADDLVAFRRLRFSAARRMACRLNVELEIRRRAVSR